HVAAKVLTVFLFFLSGASTEQGGVMTMVLLILYLLHSLGKDKSKALPLCICLCCTAIGFFTIFLSPATQTRVSDEFSLATMLNGLQSVACNFAAPRRLMPVMLIFYLCVFLLTILKKETPRALWISLPLLCLTICSCFLGQSVAVNTFNFVVFCIFVLVASLLLIFRTPYLHSGCILLAGLASVLMITVTASGSIRTCIPFMLSLILTSSFFIAEIFSVSVQNGKTYQKATRITAILVLTCVTVLRTLPTLSGVHENYKILTENENAVEAARSTGVLRYEEYAPYYSLCDMFNGTVFEATFRDKYQLYTEEIEYHVTSSDMYNASCPTIIRNTKIYYNLRSMLTLHGGSLRWMANDYLFIYYNNETFLYDAPYFCSLSTNTYRDAGDSFFVYDNSTYVSEELLGWLGIELN
ncbi:MAG: hypothetical protein IIU58_02340, partial [Clostridia bacterium]|nr:hypothetical protein [Clostridia bacterium]